MELTPEFLQTNMPQTWATLPESAWEETYVDGKIYMVPRNTAEIFPDRGPFVNMDIAEKYGFTADDIKTYETLKNCCWPSAIKSLATACMHTISPLLPTSRNWDGDTVLT